MTDLATAPAPAAGTTTGPVRGRGLSAVVWPIFGLAVAIGVWWACTEIFAINTVVLPSPPEVIDGFRRYAEYLLTETWHTTYATVLGFLLSVLVGVLIGTAIAAWRPFERMFSPLLVAFNAVPKVALAPLMLIWFGYGQTPVLAMAFMVCFFPIVLSTATGLTSTPSDLAELARSMDASRLQTFARVRLPAALPQIFVGLKVAMPLAVIGVVVGEMQYGESGLGTIIVQTSGQGDTATAFAAIMLLALISIVLYYLLVVIERLLLPWVRATTSQR
ncbi:ABC transporter permease [Actinoplanes friuliensis]|uniref:Binding-protein-dependent transport system inner membrane protein n=1 Tax=Actinoplanes friuliensis DSM 7358 TaxID=1246995 RepID=U5VQW6_9ACTN|nr:ABC transporter permease [Actinoplanes friuliensis]AGZ39239.1 binding-protein-dependent transport system inner membrane protein [Actinoplanes friuliensis DSM 7358]